MKFIHDFVHVDRACDEVRLTIQKDEGAWLGAHASRASADGDALRMRIGLSHLPPLAKEVRVTLGKPREREDVLVVPLTWAATHLARLFPVMEADLEVAPLGQSATQISLLGRYEPPLGALGRQIDRLLFHRVAEASVRSFLRRVAHALEAVSKQG